MFFDCAVRGLGILNYESGQLSGEDYLVRCILPRYLPPTPTIIDVGANVGRYSEALLQAYPNAALHAFEPNPNSFSKLKKSLGGRVTCLNQGLSDSEGELTLYDRADDAGSEHASLYGGVISQIHKADVAPLIVSLTTLDMYCERQNIPRIDFLKIDTEGHEMKVLQGASRMLSEGRIGVIQIEFNEMNTVSRCFYRDFLAQLPNHVLFRLLPKGLLQVRSTPLHQELFAFQNLIALPTKSLSTICSSG